MSTWEEVLVVRANSVRLRENNMVIQEEAIRLLENRCDTLLCKICLVHDSDVLLVPCMHISICTQCKIRPVVTEISHFLYDPPKVLVPKNLTPNKFDP